MPTRHPLGRTCGKSILPALLLFLPLTIRGVYRDKKAGVKLSNVFN